MKKQTKSNWGKLEEAVKKVLEQDKLSRVNDKQLIYQVLLELQCITPRMTFQKVMQLDDLPSFHSITRFRRKLQTIYPKLRDEEIYNKRHAKQQDYIEYNRSKR